MNLGCQPSIRFSALRTAVRWISYTYAFDVMMRQPAS